MARHRLRWWSRRQQRPARRRRVIEVVDAGTLLTHQLTPDAAAEGRLPRGRYVALCGAEVLPAAMVEPGRGTCARCLRVVVT